jgi:hypothetical protein
VVSPSLVIFRGFDLIDMRLAIRGQVDPQALVPRSPATSSDLARQVLWTYTFHHPPLAELLSLAGGLLDARPIRG